MNYSELILTFTSIIYEALPFIVLGVVLAGLLEEFVPQQLIAYIVPKSRGMHIGAIALGGLLGLIFPMCECGIIPVMRRLLRKGIPLSVCVCYMLAGPIINVVVMVSTYKAFSAEGITIFGGPKMAVILRVGFGFVVAFITSMVVDWQHRKYGKALLAPSAIKDLEKGEEDAPTVQEPFSVLRSVGNVTGTALHDFVDIMAFLVLGAFLATVMRFLMPDGGLVNGASVQEMNPFLAIPLMMFFAITFCLCSEADAFVAANFQPISAWPAASKLAFLVLGPMLDLKLLMMFTRVYRPRLIWTIVLCLVVLTFVFMIGLHYAWPGVEAYLRDSGIADQFGLFITAKKSI